MAPLPARHRPAAGDVVEVARIAATTAVLGPGQRRCLWTQGCALRCPGCVVPESHPPGAGRLVTPAALAELLLAGPEVDGLTISGGEPMLHAGGLAATIRVLRAARPAWTFLSYTGYRLEALARRGTPQQVELLQALDLLIDGPYVAAQAAPLRWRGSANQRVLALTDRGVATVRGLDDAPSGIEIAVAANGALTWTGVPPQGFRAALDAALDAAGLVAEHRPEPTVIPDDQDDHLERSTQ